MQRLAGKFRGGRKGVRLGRAFWRGAAGGPGHMVGSPIKGWPRWVRCTRIWWVRPVSSRHSIRRANGRSGCRIFHHPVAGAGSLPPPRSTAMRLRSNGLRPIWPSITPSPSARAAPHHRVIGPLDGVVGELLGEARHRPLVFGGDQQPDGVLVEAVDDAGPRLAADAVSSVAAMGDQGIDQRAVRIAGGGMHDQTGRLLDDDQVLVLIDHVEREYPAPCGPRVPIGEPPAR